MHNELAAVRGFPLEHGTPNVKSKGFENLKFPTFNALNFQMDSRRGRGQEHIPSHLHQVLALRPISVRFAIRKDIDRATANHVCVHAEKIKGKNLPPHLLPCLLDLFYEPALMIHLRSLRLVHFPL